ncbi:glyoxylase-like metal-dependent hydrolase (beta-lactamase superfamily II) [Pacificibacter maritimus]|uniref:Glyoxylase-like metal-dependent hydrolase (Beta-lactamase superfamily II) n=1 Tax=Pacificibacter maritimus TaxID=762213 RepID=A0A3N4U8Z1_9RHOB|nr:MBL fold metallo-hydrolase [Pacificibacter maritimus]RPE66268.1 glyoxylase-like metal-dependent hydrolase (beta-lactamase superfamily II) [Pacificibacter maritimus]
MKDLNRTEFVAPEGAAVSEVADGVYWVRMPLPMVLNHVNVYVLDDGDGWTIVDTGVDTKTSRRIWTDLLTGPLQAKPVKRLIVTHHHLDHVGLAGWFVAEHGVELLMTRTAYLMARMLQMDIQDRPTPEMIGFWKSCGMAPEILEARLLERPFNTSDLVSPLPLGFTRLQDGDTITIGGRLWDVKCGDGHAPEHATFWSRDGRLILSGDQLLGSISPNIGVSATEPFADTVGDWITSCEKFQPFASDDQLVLTGHKLPYYGLPARLDNLIKNHHSALDRLLTFLAEPRTACDCFTLLFKRDIKASEYGLAMAEAMAHCVHLYHNGRVTRSTREDGTILWQRKDLT